MVPKRCRRGRACHPWTALCATLFWAGCAIQPVAVHRGPVIYGADDRLEYFEVTSEQTRDTMAGSVVALVPRSVARFTDGVFAVGAPTWGEAANLCPGEPFADQPAAAFCSGVLLDWDLVLTAGHCARVLAPEDMAVVFNYHYSAPGRLAVRSSDVAGVTAIVAEALDPEGATPRVDYAWLRLSRPAVPPAQPAAVYAHESPLDAADSIVSIGSGGGVPTKVDAGGVVRDARSEVVDYFVADTDTSHGSSGGGAFDTQLALAGIMVRGGPDLVATSNGCQANSTSTARRRRSSSPTRAARSKASAPLRELPARFAVPAAPILARRCRSSRPTPAAPSRALDARAGACSSWPASWGGRCGDGPCVALGSRKKAQKVIRSRGS